VVGFLSDALSYLGQALVIFTAAIVATRLLGKAAIVQLTPFDLVAIVIIGTLIAEPLLQGDLGGSLVGVGLLVLLHVFFSRLALFGRVNKLLLGEPSIVVEHGRIVVENLRRNSLSVAQLLAILRSSGYPYLEDIEYALLEPIGQVSVLPRQATHNRGLPLPVILDGAIHGPNLELAGKTSDWLTRELRRLGLGTTAPVLYAYVEKPDTLYVNLKDGTSRCNKPNNRRPAEDGAGPAGRETPKTP